MSATGMDGQHAIEFFILDREAKIAGYTWLIEWSTTSFYIKSLYKPLQATKVSLHGPDPKYIDEQHFRFGFEKHSQAVKAVNAGGGWSADAVKTMPLYFPGKKVNKRTLHVVRFSAGWEMFVKGIPTAPLPSVKQKATLHAIVSAPPRLCVTHVDIFLSTARPYWDNERKARHRDAGMGPITNSAGMYLTARNYQRSVTDQPDPFGEIRGDVPIDQCARGVAACIDPSGFLWLCEKVIPRSKVGSTSPPPLHGGAPPPASTTTS